MIQGKQIPAILSHLYNISTINQVTSECQKTSYVVYMYVILA
jgi:hypothetical protein